MFLTRKIFFGGWGGNDRPASALRFPSLAFTVDTFAKHLPSLNDGNLVGSDAKVYHLPLDDPRQALQSLKATPIYPSRQRRDLCSRRLALSIPCEILRDI